MSEQTEAHGLIVSRSMGEIRRRAMAGRAFYSCERFEDEKGRLLVGVGAKLQGRALMEAARSGRRTILVSPIALCDERLFNTTSNSPGTPTSEDLDPQGRTSALPRAVSEALPLVSRVCPEAAGLIARMRPRHRDLVHGMRVAMYAWRLMASCNDGGGRTRDAYPNRDLEVGFVVGLVHDLGRWNQGEPEGHAERGANLLRAQSSLGSRLHVVAEMVSHHHTTVHRFRGDRWTLHRVAPVSLAEAILEAPVSRREAVSQLMREGHGGVEALLVALCNLERFVPPLAIVKTGEGPGAQLAASLQTRNDEDDRPFMVRFATLNARGRPIPVHIDSENPAPSCFLDPADADRTDPGLRVVSLLTGPVYERTFARFERIVPLRAMRFSA